MRSGRERARASPRSSAAWPASRRASISVVVTPTSATRFRAGTRSTVRTLWPISRPMSQRNVTRSLERRDAERIGAAAAAAPARRRRSRGGARRGRSRRRRPAPTSRRPAAQCTRQAARSTASIERGPRVHQRLDRLVGEEARFSSCMRLAQQRRDRRPDRRRRRPAAREAAASSGQGAAGGAAGSDASSDSVSEAADRRVMSAINAASRSAAPSVSTSKPVARHEDRVLPLRRQRVVLGDTVQPSRSRRHVALAGIDHRLDREGHAGLELEAGAGLAVVQDLRVLVVDRGRCRGRSTRAPRSSRSPRRRSGSRGRCRRGARRGAPCGCRATWPRSRSRRSRCACDRGLADAEHAAGVAVEAVLDDGDVDVDDVAGLAGACRPGCRGRRRG